MRIIALLPNFEHRVEYANSGDESNLVPSDSLTPDERFTDVPPRFTDATLASSTESLVSAQIGPA